MKLTLITLLSDLPAPACIFLACMSLLFVYFLYLISRSAYLDYQSWKETRKRRLPKPTNQKSQQKPKSDNLPPLPKWYLEQEANRSGFFSSSRLQAFLDSKDLKD